VIAELALALLHLQAEPCSGRRVASGAETWVVSTPSRRDSLVTAVVCLKHAEGVKVGSYYGELVFDSTTARVVDVARAAGGMRVENARDGGRVRFAGAEPTGFTQGMLLRVTLRLTRPGKVPAIALQMRELNSTQGGSLLVAKGAPR
jgi:hypothetical protein